jgi:hypothetical protein
MIAEGLMLYNFSGNWLWKNVWYSFSHVYSVYCDDAVVVVRLPPPWFELQIFRLPGKGGYSARPAGTTNSLIIQVEIYVASVTVLCLNTKFCISPVSVSGLLDRYGNDCFVFVIWIIKC